MRQRSHFPSQQAGKWPEADPTFAEKIAIDSIF
jgi:hypothetical protein